MSATFGPPVETWAAGRPTNAGEGWALVPHELSTTLLFALPMIAFLILITALVGGCFVVESQRAKRLRYGATGREAQPLQQTPAGASKA